MTRLSPLARALCDLALVECCDEAAGKVLAVPMSWALAQIADPPEPEPAPAAVVLERTPKPHGYQRVPETLRARILATYRAGHGTRGIAAELGLQRQTVRSVLRTAGLCR